MKSPHHPIQPASGQMRQAEDDAFWLSQESHGAGTHIVRHCHPDFMQLIFIVSGCACFCFDDRLIIAGQGSAVFIPASVAHSIDMPRQTRLRAIAIFSPQSLTLGEYPCQLQVSPLLDALSVAVSAFPQQKPATAQEQRLWQVFIDQLLSTTPDMQAIPVADDARLRKAIALLTAGDHFSKTSRDICQQIGIGERTLTRLFITLTGMTFGEYRKRIQMEYAITLLQSGISVTEVALQVGYETQSGFIYAFRHYTGMAPGQYKSRAPA